MANRLAYFLACMLLTETLGWKEGPDGENNTSSNVDSNDVTKLDK